MGLEQQLEFRRGAVGTRGSEDWDRGALVSWGASLGSGKAKQIEGLLK